MWCPSCQTDVAGEVAADGQGVQCTSCGTEVSSTSSLSLHPKTQSARELLERWSAEELLQPDASHASPSHPTEHAETQSASTASRQAELPSSDESVSHRKSTELDADSHRSGGEPQESSQTERSSRRKFRLDREHATRIGSDAPVPAPHPRRHVEPTPRRRSKSTRIDNAHEQASAPHFNIASAFEGKSKPGQGESLWGQVLAYSGVGLLTVGTVMVLWGYFGGPESYTPTGWLLASAGQMLLFLGVVTLVSGGMEQTTHEVSRRIEFLGDQLIRIEKHTQEQLLRGPHYASHDESESHERQMSKSSRDEQLNG